MSAQFSHEARQVGEVHLVALRGELDMAMAEGLADWLVRIAGSSVIVDLSELTFMDSSGITALVMARNRMAEEGNELVLTRPHPVVRRVLEATGLGSWVVDWDPEWGTGFDPPPEPASDD